MQSLTPGKIVTVIASLKAVGPYMREVKNDPILARATLDMVLRDTEKESLKKELGIDCDADPAAALVPPIVDPYRIADVYLTLSHGVSLGPSVRSVEMAWDKAGSS